MQWAASAQEALVGPAPAVVSGSTVDVANHVAPLKVATLPFRFAIRQNRLAVHEIACGLPEPPMVTGPLQVLPVNAYAWPPASIATQDLVVGQETASIDAVHPRSRAVAADQEVPLNVNAFPSQSTPTQTVEVAQDTNPARGCGPKPTQLPRYSDGQLLVPFQVQASTLPLLV
jgi:hypothetical protein